MPRVGLAARSLGQAARMLALSECITKAWGKPGWQWWIPADGGFGLPGVGTLMLCGAGRECSANVITRRWMRGRVRILRGRCRLICGG